MRSTAFIALVLLTGCGEDATVDQVVSPPPVDLLQENRDAIKLENRDIDLYVQRHELQMLTSGTGVRRQVLRDVEGPNARPGEWATVNYRMELLNGDSAYASAAGQPESFKVEEDDVESGLHEAIQELSAGDSAIIIIPSVVSCRKENFCVRTQTIPRCRCAVRWSTTSDW